MEALLVTSKLCYIIVFVDHFSHVSALPRFFVRNCVMMRLSLVLNKFKRRVRKTRKRPFPSRFRASFVAHFMRATRSSGFLGGIGRAGRQNRKRRTAHSAMRLTERPLPPSRPATAAVRCLQFRLRPETLRIPSP